MCTFMNIHLLTLPQLVQIRRCPEQKSGQLEKCYVLGTLEIYHSYFLFKPQYAVLYQSLTVKTTPLLV